MQLGEPRQSDYTDNTLSCYIGQVGEMDSWKAGERQTVSLVNLVLLCNGQLSPCLQMHVMRTSLAHPAYCKSSAEQAVTAHHTKVQRPEPLVCYANITRVWVCE